MHCCPHTEKRSGRLVGSIVSSEPRRTGRFNAGVKGVLPEIFQRTPDNDTFLKLLYKGARCALDHSARPRSPIGLGHPDNQKPIAYERGRGKVVISPERLPTKSAQRPSDEIPEQTYGPRKGGPSLTLRSANRQKLFVKTDGVFSSRLCSRPRWRQVCLLMCDRSEPALCRKRE
jgi:hypothetical protein